MSNVVSDFLNVVGGIASTLVFPAGTAIAGAEGKDPFMDPSSTFMAPAALAGTVVGAKGPSNYAFGSGQWAAPGASQDPSGGLANNIPPSLSGTPSGTASSGGGPAPGSAGTPSAVSPSMKAAITGAITGQLPGLISADEATGMTGLSPAFLSSQAGEASGFTNQQQLIQQAVQNWLSQNNVNLP